MFGEDERVEALATTSGREEAAAESLGVGLGLGVALASAVDRCVGHPIDVIESRLKEEEDEVLKQLHTIDERLKQWQSASAD